MRQGSVDKGVVQDQPGQTSASSSLLAGEPLAGATCPDRPGPIAVTVFSGGRGAASIAGQLLRTPGVDVSLIVNGYDNGMSTGALRRYLPGMLGPSDFRKNLLLHLDPGDPGDAALRAILEHRLPAGAGRADLDRIAAALGTSRDPDWAALPGPARAAIGADLAALQRRLDRRPDGLDLAGCALGNLVLAGAYLHAGGDFNAAVAACARTFGSPARLLNVTSGENAFLVALKQDGQLLADEADIVARQDPAAITGLFLLDAPLPRWRLASLAGRPVHWQRRRLARHRARVTLNPLAREAITGADLIVYGPGTPHSSLLPSYLTPGVAEAIAASRAAAKVFIVNIRDDHDVRGLTAPDLVDLTLAYLGDPFNDRHTVTHVLCHQGKGGVAAGGPAVPAEMLAGGQRAGARWVTADLEDPDRPGVHSGIRTSASLAAIARQASLVGRW